MKDIVNRVLKLMEQNNITSYRLCVDNNIPHASFRQIKNFKADFKLEQILSIAKYFNIELDDLIYGPQKPLDFIRETELDYGGKTKSVPIVGQIGCGIPLKSWESYGNKFLELYEMDMYKDPFILIAKGDSMNPYINANDYLVCADAPEKIKNRTAVVVSFKTEPETSDGNAKLIKFLKDETIMLYSVNTKYEPTIHNKDEIYKIFKIVRIIRDVK